MVVPFQIVRTQSKSRWGIPCRRVLKGLTLRCMTSKENNYSFSHAPCLSPFKLSLSDHLLTWNGIIRHDLLSSSLTFFQQKINYL
ncbi:hypothetical protein GCHA_4485 [Paraglaciecola chathamensis S18K6]|uniref:Uncharacterized protein n=1 Tax=Paraglaciecola chathamensis S18K6 TaxID=1127672 RepID=A0AAV3V5U0_9ALTE|nr:hypothetical protein GCHA_4485 [Paraglaciecola chathamensis S18K6]